MRSHVRVQSKVRVQSIVGERDRMEVLNKVKVPVQSKEIMPNIGKV